MARQRLSYKQGSNCTTSKAMKADENHCLGSVIIIRDQNVPIFKKMGPFWILLGALGVHFSNSKRPNNPLFGGKLGAKNHTKFLFRGCFSWRGQISIKVCFENF